MTAIIRRENGDALGAGAALVPAEFAAMNWRGAWAEDREGCSSHTVNAQADPEEVR